MRRGYTSRRTSNSHPQHNHHHHHSSHSHHHTHHSSSTANSVSSAAHDVNSNVSRKRIEDIFNKYCDNSVDKDDNKIGPEGIQKLFSDIDLNPLDITSLIFAYKLKAKVPFEFSKSEFIEGCYSIKCDTLDKLKKTLPLLKQSLYPSSPSTSSAAGREEFRLFYMFAFHYNKPKDHKSLPLEIAIQLFPILLQNKFTHLDLWLDFLNTKSLPISKDTYTLLLDFANTINENMSNFDEQNGAWPVLLDEFVEFAKPKIQQSNNSNSIDSNTMMDY